MTTTTKLSAGAMRAAHEIANMFIGAIISQSEIDCIATAIDRETGAGEMLKTLERAEEELRLIGRKDTGSV